MEKIIKEVSRTSVNGAIINRKFSPAVFRNETMKKINLQCHIVNPEDVAARYKSKGITAQIFPDGEIALIQYAFTGKDISKEVMKFFNDVCGEDLGHTFEQPNKDYLVLPPVPFTPRGGHPELYVGIAIPLSGKLSVSDDILQSVSKSRALSNFTNEKKRIEEIFVSSFNKLRSATEKSYHLLAYSNNKVKTKDKVVLFFACDQLPPGDALVKQDITKIINKILSENTQIKRIYDNSAITPSNITRYGDVETKRGPMTIFYLFMNMAGTAVDLDESKQNYNMNNKISIGALIDKINEAIVSGKLKEDDEVKLMYNGNYYSVSDTNYDKTHDEFYLFFDRDSTEYMTISELLQAISESEAKNISNIIGSINAELEDYITKINPTTDDSMPILGLEIDDFSDEDYELNESDSSSIDKLKTALSDVKGIMYVYGKLSDGTIVKLTADKESQYSIGNIYVLPDNFKWKFDTTDLKYALLISKETPTIYFDENISKPIDINNIEFDGRKFVISIGDDNLVKMYKEKINTIDINNKDQLSNYDKKLDNIKKNPKLGFYDWGYINGMNGKTEQVFNTVNSYHAKIMKSDKSKHNMSRDVSQSGNTEHYRCTCGFAYSVDSSD